jgi:type 2 lantibiotic biosynthesis protein LanM
MIEIPTYASIDRRAFLQDPAWYRALTLPERLAHLEKGSAQGEYDVERAERRLQKWKKQYPFEKEDFFAQRLTVDQVTEDELRFLLGESAQGLRDRTSVPPDWLLTLASIFEHIDDCQEFTLPDIELNQHLCAFLEAMKPFLKAGFDQLKTGVDALKQRYVDLPFDPTTIISLLYANLARPLLEMLNKTFILELNIARLQGELQGDTPEARFDAFIQNLRDPEHLLTLLQRYPVLTRSMLIMVDQWANYSLEFLQHLCADWRDCCALFQPGTDPGIVVAVEGGIGDTHRQGRSVLRVAFSSGFQLLYKPKSLAIDAHFQDVLLWLNSKGASPAFRAIKILDRGSYGWSEFVTAQPCTSEEEVARFYERQGGYLALFYALKATDMHHENLIASGEHPIFIDLEALFYPRVKGIDALLSDNPAERILERSVVRIDLLPMRLWAHVEHEGIDISGLGSTGGQLSPHKWGVLEHAGTDQMRIAFQHIQLPEKQNRPSLSGTEIDVLHHTEHVVAGFTRIYHLLLAHREEFLSTILPRFAFDTIRIIPRPTHVYVRIQQGSMHPRMLQDALDRDRFFDCLWHPIEQLPHLARIIPIEREDFYAGDVPLFTTRPNSVDIFTSRGERIADFLEAPSLELVAQRIREMSEEDLSKQCWFIRASFASVKMTSEEATWKPSQLRPVQTPVKRNQLMDAARAVGDRLCELAHWEKEEIFWIGLTLVREREWAITSASLDLYSGMSGIVLFLAYLGTLTRNRRYTDLAHAGLLSLQKQGRALATRSVEPGTFNGLGGMLYLYAHLGACWNDTEILAEAEKMCSWIIGNIERDNAYDIISGSAGGILSLLALYHVTSSLVVLHTALQLGDHLLAHAQVMSGGMGWPSPLAKHPLTGFSHGAAGIAFSLLRLAEVSGEQRFRDAALAAIAYERSLFSPQMRNWPDLREETMRSVGLEVGSTVTHPALYRMAMWCHGAPGIGLARLASLHCLDDAAVRDEIEVALGTTLAQGFGMNHCLCHGDLGNLDVVLTASQVLGERRYREEVDRLTAMILASIEHQGWSTGVPLGTETPGLMTGIAGIGYELLRLAEPDKVPSVLLLAPPVVQAAISRTERGARAR